MSSYVIFDFDGTLADMKTLFLEIGNEIAAKKGWPKVDEKVYQKLRKGNIKDGLKTLGIPLRDVPFTILQAKRMLATRTDEIKLFEDIPDLITKLHSDGHELFVLSTNSKKIIVAVLGKFGLQDKIKVLPSSGLFGKAPALKRFARAHRAKKADIWYVGDELRDVEAAKKAGVHNIAVTWGLQHPDALRDAQPEFLADKPEDVKFCVDNSI